MTNIYNSLSIKVNNKLLLYSSFVINIVFISFLIILIIYYENIKESEDKRLYELIYVWILLSINLIFLLSIIIIILYSN